MKKESRQFVIYSRKSKFTGKGESIENQIELCRQYSAVHYSQEEADGALVYEDDTAIMGLNQNPVQTGVDLVPFFFLSALFSANEGVPA